MKCLLPIVFLVLIHFSSLSQHWEIDRYEVDTLQIYNPQETTYTFYIDAKSQGFFVNKEKVVWLPGVRIKIVNNTGKTITNNTYREHDGRVMWYREKWNKTLQPGEEMILVSKWSAHRMPRVPFSRSISFVYTIDTSSYSFSLQTWGEFVVDLDEQKRASDRKKAALAQKNAVKQTEKQPVQKTKISQAPLLTRTYDTIQRVKKKSYYRGEQVNRRTRKDFKIGKWVTLYEDNKLKTLEFYSGKDHHWDSAYFYYETTGRFERKLYHVKLSETAIKKQEFNDQGILYKTFLWNGEEIIESRYKTYYPDKTLRSEYFPFPMNYRLDYYQNGRVLKKSLYSFEGKLDTVLYYHNSEAGGLKRMELYASNDRVRYRYDYDEDGDLLLREDVYHRTSMSYKYLEKKDSFYVVESYYNGKLSWTDRGTRKNNDLWSGTRTSSQGGIYSFPKVYIEGRQNGFYYKGEWVNRSDTLRQQGKWLTFHRSGGIKEFAMYTNGVRDSVYTYYEFGELNSIVYSRGPFSKDRRQRKRFYEGGEVKFEEGGFESDTVWVSYFRSGEFNQLKKRNGDVYHFEKGDVCTYKVIRPKRVNGSYSFDGMNHYAHPRVRGYGPEEHYYKNCKLYKRITSKYYRVDGVEGGESQTNSYEIEKGDFVDEMLYTGTREYYNSDHRYVRTVQVRKGQEI